MDRESENERHARVEKLWKSLHTGPIVPLDLDGLRDGLRKIEHPLANATDILKDVMKAVDANHNGKIEFEEFRVFVEHAEAELWQLFKTIDRDHSGRLDKNELRIAFKRAGISIEDAKLASFFDRIDANNDGSISFEEWRDFLLFLPKHSTSIETMFSYFSSSLLISAEGDVHVVDENLQGLGTKILVPVLFGVFLRIAFGQPSPSTSPQHNPKPSDDSPSKRDVLGVPVLDLNTFPWDPGERPEIDTMGPTDEDDESQMAFAEKTHGLTSLLPDPGYFLAGGIAGAISRTSTAPLDRLKVYLIAQTSIKKEALDAVKSGSLGQAARHASRPLFDAAQALWKMGGMRSLFAGNGLNVIKVMPESAIKFGSYEGVKRVMARLEGHNDPKKLHPWSQFFCAGMGGMISQFAIYPLDTLKFRMQCETVEGGAQGSKLIAETARKLLRSGGLLAYYRGLGMGLTGMFPYSAIDLTIYEYLKRLATASRAKARGCPEQEATPGGMLTGGIGALSSSVGASAVYPLNLLRTRLQSQGTAIHPPTYAGWRDCLAKTVKVEGARGLYRGLTPNLLKVVPSMSISYMVYEASKKVLGLR